MELSVREAAVLLGRKPRTVRAQLARGELPGTKRAGVWRIDGRKLPLTEAQRNALQRKADRVRTAVEDALPSRMAARAGQRSRSIADLDAFRRGAEVLAEMRMTGDSLEEAPRQVERLDVAMTGRHAQRSLIPSSQQDPARSAA